MKRWLILLIGLVLISALTHGTNMFHYPYFEDDEGTYMSQAWATINLGKLAPYTYFYDHAPAGWLLIALWTKLTGGFFTFGFSLNSGRVLMLILFLSSCLFLYFITKKLTKSSVIAAISILFFSFSPLGIYFQRRILLDNIMIFWVLLSLTLLLYFKINIKTIILSGLLLGIAIVTKENAIFFIPGFIYFVFVKSQKQKLISSVTYLVSSIIPVLIYFVYALIRREFFPYGTILGGAYPHVSLIGTWLNQISRSGGNILNSNSLLRQSLFSWYQNDPITIFLGVTTTLLNIILGLRFFANRIAAIFSLLFMFFLLRGGVVFDFYILPLLPFFALNFSLALWGIFKFIHQKINIKLGFILSTLVLIIMSFDLFFFGNRSKNSFNIFTSDQTTPQIEAANWILSQNNPQSFYAIDNYSYVDLHANQDNHFKYAEYYWKVDEDPNISTNILKNDWHNVNFVAATPQMKLDLINNKLPLTQTALKNSTLIKHFFNDGWGVDIWQVIR